MKLDTSILFHSLTDVPALARAAESLGFDGVWTAETQHDPFLPLALVAEHTARLEFGTAIAVAFARSPTVVAHTAWDLADVSGGRFRLGLGTQVKAHIERRFGMAWDAPPVPRLREYLGALRAVWQTWQATPQQRLNFRGDHYKLTLMTPFFSPAPIRYPHIPIFIAGVNPPLIQLAGEAADGFHVHPLHTIKYLREVVHPAIARGAAKAGRDPRAVQISATPFVALGESEEARAAERAVMRAQIAFYASTPSYRGVLALHGWQAQGERLSALASRGKWDEMAAEVTDEMLAEMVVEGAWGDAAEKIHARYAGLADRLGIYRHFNPAEGGWKRFAQAFKAAEAAARPAPLERIRRATQDLLSRRTWRLGFEALQALADELLAQAAPDAEAAQTLFDTLGQLYAMEDGLTDADREALDRTTERLRQFLGARPQPH